MRGRKLSNSIAFITESFFRVPKDFRLSCIHFFFNIKVPKNWELQQIVFDRLSDIKSEDVTYIYKEYTAKPYPFLVIDITILADNPLHLRKNFLERIWKLIMTTDDKIIDEKLQYDINREAAKISALSSSKIGKYDYITGEEILSSDENRMIKQAKFTYEKQTKTIKHY